MEIDYTKTFRDLSDLWNVRDEVQMERRWREKLGNALRAVRGDRYCYCWIHNTDAEGNKIHTPECREAMRLTGCEYGE